VFSAYHLVRVFSIRAYKQSQLTRAFSAYHLARVFSTRAYQKSQLAMVFSLVHKNIQLMFYIFDT